MDAYERNLQRLKKAEKLLDLAAHSGTLKDRDWVHPLNTPAQFAWAGIACLQLATSN